MYLSETTNRLLMVGIYLLRLCQFIVQMITRLYKLPPISTNTADDIAKTV